VEDPESVDELDLTAYFERLGIALGGSLDALRTVVETRTTLARIESLLVERARSNGSSWIEIGDALGVSRQAAYTRHRPFVSPTDGECPRPRR
jgi:hypothetical protein